MLEKKRIKALLTKEFTNILGIDEHTALIINGEKNSFEVIGIGNVTVLNPSERQSSKKKVYII